jgi:hypothetical protein
MQLDLVCATLYQVNAFWQGDFYVARKLTLADGFWDQV